MIEAYINFNGNCREAVEFYANAFGTEKPKIMAYGDTPPDAGFPLTEETKNLVMHALLDIQGTKVMFSDVPPGMPLIVGTNISLVMVSKDMDEVKALFHKFKEGGTIGMDLQKTFWSQCYGSLTDKFGIGWQFSFGDGTQMGQ